MLSTLDSGSGGQRKQSQLNVSPKQPAQWRCRWSSCTAAKANSPNHQLAGRCKGCGKPKGTALNPPALQALPPPPPATPASPKAAAVPGLASKRAVRRRKRAGETRVADSPASGAAPSASEAKAAAAWEKVTEPDVSLPAVDSPARHHDARVTVRLPAELVDSLTDIKPALGPIVDSLTLEVMPRDVSLDTPERVLDSYLKDVGPCSSAAEVEKLEAQIASARTALDVLQGTSAAKGLEQQIADNQAAITRIRKKPTSSEAMRIALGQAKDRFLATRQDKIDVAAKGKATSIERSCKRHALLVALQEQLDAFVDALEAVENGHAQAHAKRNASRETRDQQVIALFDARIVAASALAVPAASAAVTAAVPPLAAPEGATTASSDVSMAVAAQPTTATGALAAPDELLQQFAQEKARLEAQVAQLNAFVVAEDQFARRATSAPELGALPEFAVESEQQRQACTGLLALIDRWEANGAMMPFTFQDAQACLPSALPLGDLARGLLGPLWGLWFDADVNQSTVLPKQAVETLQTALERVQAGLDLELAPTQVHLDAASSAIRALAAKRPRIQ